MKKLRLGRQGGQKLQLLPALIAFILTLLTPQKAALAHPLDEYLQATYITVAPTQIVVRLKLSPGVLVAPQVLAELDADGNQHISEAEGQTYGTAVLANVILEVDGQPALLTVTQLELPTYINLQAGYGVINVYTVAHIADGLTGTHQIYYKNGFAPTGSAYQVNTFVETGATIMLGKQNRDEAQQSLSVDYSIDEATTVVTTADLASSETTAQTQALLSYLYEPTLSPWALILAVVLAGVLGGLHALTPGHGKTLVAAYLVGSRGTVRHAISLGAIVTFTHTASVIVAGLLALFASQFIVPEILMPVLETLSGLLVVFLGLRLVWQRWAAFRQRDVHHVHPRTHSHDGHHHHAEHTHTHDRHTHPHLPPAEGLKFSNLLAMGVSGGLLPCPEALGIMVIAIGLNRILLGLSLILSFSFGLAMVLIIIGILLVRSRSLVERLGGFGGRWSQALPLVSAVIVTVLGVGIMASGMVNYWQ